MKTRSEQRLIPSWAKWAWLAWILVWVPVYWAGPGPVNFLWFCDVANFVIALALWLESPLLLSSQAVGVFFIQCLWAVDFFGRLLLGFHPIGGTEYMFDPQEWLATRTLSLFHLIVPLVLVWGLKRLGYDARGLTLQTAFAALLFPASWFAGPELNLNWAWKPFGVEQVWLPPELYLLLCLPLTFLLVYWPSHRLFRSWFGGRES